MGSTSRAKRNQYRDFQKVKLKAGGISKRRAHTSDTRLSVKSKQLNVHHAPIPAAVAAGPFPYSKHTSLITVKQALKQLAASGSGHVGGTSTAKSLECITRLLNDASTHPIDVDTRTLLSALGRHLLDDSESVRRNASQALCTFVERDLSRGFVAQLLTYIAAALTHHNPNRVESAIDVIDALVRHRRESDEFSAEQWEHLVRCLLQLTSKISKRVTRRLDRSKPHQARAIETVASLIEVYTQERSRPAVEIRFPALERIDFAPMTSSLLRSDGGRAGFGAALIRLVVEHNALVIDAVEAATDADSSSSDESGKQFVMMITRLVRVETGAGVDGETLNAFGQLLVFLLDYSRRQLDGGVLASQFDSLSTALLAAPTLLQTIELSNARTKRRIDQMLDVQSSARRQQSTDDRMVAELKQVCHKFRPFRFQQESEFSDLDEFVLDCLRQFA